ncbi:MAG: pseudaminic acid synthase [Deltaproteobacteria bacterium]|nr:pseudaminic acid synthase [Deltaproteobacteria bacterium]
METGVITVKGRRVGPGFPAYIVAELSANHGQNLGQAIEIVKAAKTSGADAIKLQTYRPDTMTLDCDNEYFRIQGTLWKGRTLYDLYREAYTPWEWHPVLQQIADGVGLDFFSTPFDEKAVAFLEALQVPVFKVASFENGDLPLLRRIAATGTPMIVSTGMATLGEIEEMVRTIRGAGGDQLVLLKCTSAYPAPPEEMNLRAIPHLAERFGLPVGVSDHSMGVAVPVAAVALGACIIEKHFTLSRSLPGPDSAFSLEPYEFREMVEAVRVAEKALGRVRYGRTHGEKENCLFRRSLFVVKNIKAGETFTAENIRSIRPGHGLHTRYLPEILGCCANQDIGRGTPLGWEMVGRKEMDRSESARQSFETHFKHRGSRYGPG